jgi:hypothetical protein
VQRGVDIDRTEKALKVYARSVPEVGILKEAVTDRKTKTMVSLGHSHGLQWLSLPYL